MTKEMLEPGTYIDSHWGHYQSVRVIELGMSLGYEDTYFDEDQLNVLIQAYEDNEEELTLKLKDGNTQGLTQEGYSVAECVYETQEDVLDYINEHHTPEDHWFGHHPDLGDVGVWEFDDE